MCDEIMKNLHKCRLNEKDIKFCIKLVIDDVFCITE